MNDGKPMWASTGVWGAVSVLAVSVASLAGYNIGDAGGWATGIVTLLGAGLSLWGRIKASKKITSLV